MNAQGLTCGQTSEDGRRLVFQAHRLVYHSTLGVRVTKKKEEAQDLFVEKCLQDLLDPAMAGHLAVLYNDSEPCTGVPRS